ncbi:MULTISPECIES: ECF transporter S component [Lacticaseibacillus]|uniref:ECF transporter S component n=1 Tax=Lacticaseibacillus hegangensis TaxID=2486010 RepID=A0ABW4CXB2_9LACO|nr:MULTISPECIES: ECF transporter S component [Lacticaseibacillus]
MGNRSRAYRVSMQALFLALIAVQTMVPMLGYLPLGFVNLTIIHITVIIGAIMFGPGEGLLIGTVWGVLTIVRAYTAPTSPMDTLVFTNPLVSVVPRMLVGVFAALTFWGVYKLFKKIAIASVVAGAIGSLTNTVLVLLAMGTLYTGPVASAYKVSTGALGKVLGAIVVTNGVPEMIGAMIITPLIVGALVAATHMRPWRAAKN